MADDSLEMQEVLEWSASAAPRSGTPYDADALTSSQQRALNLLRVQTARDDERYLAAHPQVRAMLSLLLRMLFRDRPRCVHTHAAKFFRRPHLESELRRYMERNPADPEFFVAEVAPPSIDEQISQEEEIVDERGGEEEEEEEMTQEIEEEESLETFLGNLIMSEVTTTTEWLVELIHSNLLARTDSRSALSLQVELDEEVNMFPDSRSPTNLSEGSELLYRESSESIRPLTQSQQDDDDDDDEKQNDGNEDIDQLEHSEKEVGFSDIVETKGFKLGRRSKDETADK